MSHINFLKRTTALSVSSALLFAGMISSSTAADDDELELEEVVVTGSRIPRADLVSNSPLSVITAEQFQITGTVETEALLNTMPQIVASNSSTTNNPGNGTATINLRNLGTSRTLVLVNGRRFVGSSASGVVDINNISPALIERVEVVTGGASAVYGSDAMAGVVNFIMKKDFEGLVANASYGISQHGDSDRLNFDITAGTNFADDRGNITFTANYFKRSQTLASERDFALFSNNESNSVAACEGAPPCLIQGGSSRIPEGRFSGGGVSPSPVIFQNDGGVRKFVFANDAFNFQPFNNLQLPLERWQAAANLNYQITDEINFFSEFNFAHNEINRTLAPTPFNENGFSLDTRNPFLSDAQRTALQTGLDTAAGEFIVTGNFRRRMLEADSRVSTDTRTMFRFVTGFQGDLTDNITWDLFYNFGSNENTQRQDGNIVISKMQQGLLVDPNNPNQCANTSGGCLVLNPFGEGNMTQEMIDFVTTGATNLTGVTQQQAGFNMAGSALELPAGDLGFAVGLEWRKEEAKFTPDTFLASGDIDGFNAGKPTEGDFNVKEIYVETIVPILADMPGVEYLGLEAGVRFSDYSTAGSVTSYKIGGEYSPIEDLKFRGLFQRAVRAPNIQELFGGLSNGFPGGTDFCNFGPDRSQAEADFCVDVLGVPASVIDTFFQSDSQFEAIFGGNPDLGVESSDTWSIGFVYQPSQVEGLTVTADLYSIQIENAISTFGGGLSSTFAACNADLSALNKFCVPLMTRDPLSGELDSPELLDDNIGAFTSKGVDYNVSYSHDLEEMGTLDLSVSGVYVIETITQASPIVPAVDCAGFVDVRGLCGRADPKTRIITQAQHNIGDFTTNIRWRYMSAVQHGLFAEAEANGTPDPTLAVPGTSAKSYFDLGFAYRFSDTYRLTLNINNVLDQQPPELGSASGQHNTDASVYDTIGRRFQIGLRATF